MAKTAGMHRTCRMQRVFPPCSYLLAAIWTSMRPCISHNYMVYYGHVLGQVRSHDLNESKLC